MDPRISNWKGKKEFKNSRTQKNNYSQCMSELKMWTRTEKTIHAHNSWEHEQLKCKIIYLLKRAGHQVVAEAEFKSGGRCDVLDACCCNVYEILKSETLAEFEVKKAFYPRFLTVVPVLVDELDLVGLIKFLGVD